MKPSKNNKGFTLVEVVIGVAILGIIAGPLFLAFITSMRTAVRSQELGDATVVAENIVEDLTYADFEFLPKEHSDYEEDEITAPKIQNAIPEFLTYAIEDGNTVYKEYVASESTELQHANGEYILYAEGAAHGTSTFNARITLDPTYENTSDGIEYAKINQVEVTQYSQADANIIKQNGSEASQNPDQKAETEFEKEMTRRELEIDTIDITHRERTIHITLSGDSRANYKVEAEYSYKFTYEDASGFRSTIDIKPTEPIESSIIFPSDIDANEEYVPSIYVIYTQYGGYLTNTGVQLRSDAETEIKKVGVDEIHTFKNFTENIIIDNKTTGTANSSGEHQSFNVFAVADLIENRYVDASNVAIISATHTPDIDLVVRMLSLRDTVNIFSNSDSTDYNVKTSIVGVDYAGSETDLDKQIVRTEAENRVYGVTIELLEPGTDEMNAEVVHTLQTTIVK